MFNILIVNFNTPELTEACIRSIYKQMSGEEFAIHLFDNSDKRPLTYRTKDMIYHDNTKGQIIDFVKFLESYPNKKWVENDWGSAKHMVTIDKCFNLIPDGFIMVDSDALLKKSISCLIDKRIPFAGQVTRYKNGNPQRVLPMVCYVNVPLCRSHGIRYFDPYRSFALDDGPLYDTGGSFLEDCINEGLNGRCIRYHDYVEHLGGGSWRKGIDAATFLKENERLYK